MTKQQQKNCLRGTMTNNEPKREYDPDPGGPLTEPFDPTAPNYNYKLLMAYCRKVNKRPVELTDEERAVFRTN